MPVYALNVRGESHAWNSDHVHLFAWGHLYALAMKWLSDNLCSKHMTLLIQS